MGVVRSIARLTEVHVCGYVVKPSVGGVVSVGGEPLLGDKGQVGKGVSGGEDISAGAHRPRAGL